MSFVTCWAHKTQFPIAACNEHHEVPQAAGGGDQQSNLTYLCASCHTVVHRIAEKLSMGKAGVASDIANQYAPDNIQFRNRIQELATIVATSMRKTAEGELPGKDEIAIQVFLKKDTYKKFKMFVGDKRANGRSVGMSRFITLMIEGVLKKARLL